jgi:hypothetical protein
MTRSGLKTGRLRQVFNKLIVALDSRTSAECMFNIRNCRMLQTAALKKCPFQESRFEAVYPPRLLLAVVRL